MNRINRLTRVAKMALGLSSVLLAIGGCTKQIPDLYRFVQQEQAFPPGSGINTKVDLLWVVDNSASMDVSQQKLRNGIQAFTQKYLKSNWDMKIGVITTDTYMANPVFDGYLNTTITGSTAWQSIYIPTLPQTFQNPSWNPTLVDTNFQTYGNGVQYATFPAGVTYNDLVPLWGPNYAKLIPGMHDGPIQGFCFEAMPFFLDGPTQCDVRDFGTRTGTTHCLAPEAGQSSLSECVNTIQNDTVRSGNPVILTVPQNGSSASAWEEKIIKDFTVNVTTGSVGQGSERGFSSILQFLADNETTATPFFRAGALRVIIIVSDEDDQSLEIPDEDSVPAGFKPNSHYKCNQAGLVAGNPTANITGNRGYCCNDPAKGCQYGDAGTSCPAKTVDDYTYTISVCADPDKLIPVLSVKEQLDDFFTRLDRGIKTNNPTQNYLVAAIVPLTGDSIRDLQAARDASENAGGLLHTVAVDRGDRYLEFADLVANGSLKMDIASSNYAPILDEIGKTILRNKGTFYLDRPASGKDEMSVVLGNGDGTRTTISPENYEIDGNKLMITDLNMILNLRPDNYIIVNYQPSASH